MTRHTKHYVRLAGLLCTVAAVASPIAAHGDPVAAPADPLAAPSSKIAARVAQMAARLSAPPDPAAPTGAPTSSLSNPLVHVDDSGRIELAFRTVSGAGPTEESDLAALGAVDVRAMPPRAVPGGPTAAAAAGLLEAWVPHQNIGAASELPWVNSIAPPSYGHVSAGPSGDTVSDGVALLKANLLHAKGITGAGVTVGVISDGVTSLATAQATGDLPPTVTLAGGAGAGDEGTAMLEIVHDMAPGAALAFASGGNDLLSFVNALNALAAAKVNVIVHDLAFDTEPVFEEGFIAQTIDDLSQSSGISVYAAAGNVGDSHVRVPAVGTGKGPDNKPGPFANCAKQPTNTVAIAPNGDTTFDMVASGLPNPTTVVLQWSEPSAQIAGHGGFTNLDLYVMDQGLTTCVGESDDVQADGVGDTLEALIKNSPGGGPVKLVVNVAGTSSAVAPPVLDIRWRNAVSRDAPSQVSSLNPNNNFTSGLPAAVGAFDAKGSKMDPFSGAGPVQLGSTTTCPDNGPGPCTGVAGPPIATLRAPAFTAVDNVAVSGAGGFPSPFQGTSAAAPHAGGCDALVRQAIGSPAAPILTIRDRLAASAADITPAGLDDLSGTGLLDCSAAARISNLSVTAAATPPEAKAGDTLTYAVTVKNDGPDDAVPFTVLDTLPVGTGAASSPATCASNQPAAGASQVVSCPQDALANGQTRALTITATAGSVPDGTTALVNTVTLVSAFDNTPADNTTTSSTAFSGSNAGGPVLLDALARTGSNEATQFWWAMTLVAAGGCLWLVGLDRWARPQRPRAGTRRRRATGAR